jgi:hypothetical protein
MHWVLSCEFHGMGAGILEVKCMLFLACAFAQQPSRGINGTERGKYFTKIKTIHVVCSAMPWSTAS